MCGSKESSMADLTGKKSCCSRFARCFFNNLLLLLLFLAVAGGVCAGWFLRDVPPFDQPHVNTRDMMYLYFPAELLLRMMSLLSLPLIVTSLISGVGGLSSRSSGKIGAYTLAYYLCTTVLAVSEGFAFIFIIKPGANVTLAEKDQETVPSAVDFSRLDALLDMFRNLFPDNVVTATFELTNSKISFKPVQVDNETVLVEDFSLEYRRVMNILGLTAFSIAFGVALSKISSKTRSRVLLVAFDQLFDTTMALVRAALWFYPIGTFFLVAHTIIELKDPVEVLEDLMYFILTVLLGLFTHVFIVMPILFLIFTRRNPLKHMRGCFKALLTAFATSNSTVTVPVTMECLEKMDINPRVIRFMVPVGATVNMDGFALYEVMAAIFIAMLRGMDPGPVQIVILGFSAIAISIGAPTAGNGAILFVLLFRSIGLPIKDIGILLPFDWLMGRFRTMTNVWGDCVGAAIVDKLARADLNRTDRHTDEAGSLLDGGLADDGPVLTHYHRKGPRDWTIRLENEDGDRMVVSKV